MPVFDAVLAVAIVVVAVRVLTSSDLFEAVVLFIVFGLLMSLAWTRLGAIDVALAEAAIGAGLTGALFLNALRHAPGGRPSRRPAERSMARAVAILAPAAALAAVLAAVLQSLPAGGASAAIGGAQMSRSGASNPVTAVLLNFRAYDTLLEVVVLVVAVACVRAVAVPDGRGETVTPSGAVLLAFVHLLVPVMAVVAGYLLWIGTSGPGGAFHAGAILGAAGVLLVVTGIARPAHLGTAPGLVLVVTGAGGFLAAGVGTMLAGGAFLEYPPEWASTLMLAIETLVALSTAAVLIALFSGGGARADGRASQSPHSAGRHD